MFWRFSGYANVSTLNNLLEKPDVTLPEILDDTDLLQELKQSNSRLIEYLRDENVLQQLLDLVIAPPVPKSDGLDCDDDDEDDDEAESEAARPNPLAPFRRAMYSNKQEQVKKSEDLEAWVTKEQTRLKYAYTSCEILSSDTWSILESMMQNPRLLDKFWKFVWQEAPLASNTASYFIKVNETLLDKKTEEMIAFLQTLDGLVPAMLAHIDCAAIMDLLLKMISLEKADGGAGVVDWLQSQDLIPRLLAYVGKSDSPSTQASAGDLLKAIVTISANASQTEQSCIGPNNLTRQLVSEACIEDLLSNMLRGGSCLTVGVGLVIEIIRKNNSDYDPDLGAEAEAAPASNDPIYLGTMLRAFSRRVPDFMNLLLHPTQPATRTTLTKQGKDVDVASGYAIEPLGFDRFKTCELMAELLHCSNMGLLNERGSEAYIKQRDDEREQLRIHGQLTTNTHTAASANNSSMMETFSEDGDDNDPFAASRNQASRLDGLPEQGRKLGVTNTGADDGGFEDLGKLVDSANPRTHEDEADLADLDDREKAARFEIDDDDRAGENTLTSSPTQFVRPLKPRLDMDEEFVDEPLTSPTLDGLDHAVSETNPSSTVPEPLHPQHDKEAKRDLDLGRDIEELTLDQDTVGGAFGSSSQNMTRPSVPVVASHGIDEPAHDESGTLSATSSTNRDISPHPEDKPAPLFAKTETHNTDNMDGSDTTQPQTQSAKDPDSDKSGMPSIASPALEGQSPDRSVPADEAILARPGNSEFNMQHATIENENAIPQMQPELTFEYDYDGQPMVGDALKIMFVEHRVVPTILDFFFRFPWNNFLHNVVYDVIQQVFNGPIDHGYNRTLAIDLFETGQITDRIIYGQSQSDESQASKNMRLGYMGHLTLIAEEVVKFSDRQSLELFSPIVFEKVVHPQWSEYVENVLSETRERDNAILGGVRPDVSLGPRQAVLNAVGATIGVGGASFAGGASTALTNAGLNGNTGLDNVVIDLPSDGSATSIGSNGQNSSLSSTSIVTSAFAGSSDEEDEDLDEMIDEVDTGLQTAQDTNLDADVTSALPATSSNGALIPPSDPPPAPPPLNLVPSRARRQLAARLAMHQHQQKGDEDSSSPVSSDKASSDFDATSSSFQPEGDVKWDDETSTPPDSSIPPSSASNIPPPSRLRDQSPPRTPRDITGLANSPASDGEEDLSISNLSGPEPPPIPPLMAGVLPADSFGIGNARANVEHDEGDEEGEEEGVHMKMS